ncbi:MAG: hypothetical protein A2W00_03390 [Candidatus Eisenbacteria bacterium RBG_16_71_46]|nr:MAG: hypothetical protein A2W00_03390 [Candidatus Eisenbacteria bacterium RBG_16_71_46]
MCPLCREHEGKGCEIVERSNGRLVCTCGRHSWPNAGALLESCRRQSLTVERTLHTWTQGQ